MIRVAIVAAAGRANPLAEYFAEDDLLEVVDAVSVADIMLVMGSAWEKIPKHGPPAVLVTDRPAEQGQLGQQIRAWLPLNSSAEEIRAAILASANDLVVLTSAQAGQWLRAEAAESENIFVEALTQRELQVLRMMADGLGNKEIALHLGISEHTAKFHVAQILAKLGAASRTEAVALGMRRGLVPI
ncbi:MAG: response regulator transcription factor [Bryobacteraceae bacterium]